MLSNRVQDPTEVDQPWTVQSKRFDRRSALRRNTNHDRVVLVPREMIGPTLQTRVEQRDGKATHWVGGLDTVVLVVVATLA